MMSKKGKIQLVEPFHSDVRFIGDCRVSNETQEDVHIGDIMLN